MPPLSFLSSTALLSTSITQHERAAPVHRATCHNLSGNERGRQTKCAQGRSAKIIGKAQDNYYTHSGHYQKSNFIVLNGMLMWYSQPNAHLAVSKGTRARRDANGKENRKVRE